MDLLWIIEDGKAVSYQRTGECKQCGLCCCSSEIEAQVQVGVPGDPRAEAEEECTAETDFSEYEGFSIFFSQGLWWWMKMRITEKPRDHPCGSFVDGKCSSWMQPDWPALCRYWPVHPLNLEEFPSCGFSFERVEGE